MHSTIGANPVDNDKADAVLTRDVFKGDQTSQAQSPLCIAQRCLVPSEPYQPSNLDSPHSGWQVVEDFLLLFGQQRAAGESIDLERRPEDLDLVVFWGTLSKSYVGIYVWDRRVLVTR